MLADRFNSCDLGCNNTTGAKPATTRVAKNPAAVRATEE